MARLGIGCSVLVFALILAGCASGGSGDGQDGGVGKLTYNEAVQQMGRPPTSAKSRPDGGLEATWITQTPQGSKHLILTFDSRRVLESHREEIR